MALKVYYIYKNFCEKAYTVNQLLFLCEKFSQFARALSFRIYLTANQSLEQGSNNKNVCENSSPQTSLFQGNSEITSSRIKLVCSIVFGNKKHIYFIKTRILEKKYTCMLSFFIKRTLFIRENWETKKQFLCQYDFPYLFYLADYSKHFYTCNYYHIYLMST